MKFTKHKAQTNQHEDHLFVGLFGKASAILQIFHRVCTSCFPERTKAQCHLKGPTPSSNDVRGDSCCLVVPQSKYCHMVIKSSVMFCVCDNRTIVPLRMVLTRCTWLWSYGRWRCHASLKAQFHTEYFKYVNRSYDFVVLEHSCTSFTCLSGGYKL